MQAGGGGGLEGVGGFNDTALFSHPVRRPNWTKRGAALKKKCGAEYLDPFPAVCLMLTTLTLTLRAEVVVSQWDFGPHRMKGGATVPRPWKHSQLTGASLLWSEHVSLLFHRFSCLHGNVATLKKKKNWTIYFWAAYFLHWKKSHGLKLTFYYSVVDLIIAI